MCLLPLTLQAATVFHENFDELTTGLGVTSAGAFNTGGFTNVDILGAGNFGFECLAPESGNCVDLNGTGGNPQEFCFRRMLSPLAPAPTICA